MKPDLYTKAVLTVIAVMLTMVALKPAFNPNVTAQAQTLTPKAQPARPLDAEARKEASLLWQRVLTKCGDSYYYSDTSEDRLIGGRDYLVEYKKVSFDLVPKALSPADQANGFQWRGLAIMASLLFRSQRTDLRGYVGGRAVPFDEIPSTPREWLGWSGWQDGITLAKIRTEVSGGMSSHLGNRDDTVGLAGANFLVISKQNGEWGFGLPAYSTLSCREIPGTPEFQTASR